MLNLWSKSALYHEIYIYILLAFFKNEQKEIYRRIYYRKNPKTKGFRSLSKAFRRDQTALIRDSKGSKGLF